MEEREFRYGKHIYKYVLEKSERKSFSLVVLPNLKIILRAPMKASVDDVEKFLTKKWVWLEKQLKELSRYQKINIKKEYVSGESFYYLGRQYMMQVEKGKVEGVKVLPGRVVVTTSKNLRDSLHNKVIYDEWYSGKCEVVFKKELYLMVKKYGIERIPKMKIREMKSRWGSYQKNGTINLNPKLLQAPRAAIRYVITHELCHIEYKNHDEKFYDLLESRVPDWRKVKDELELRFG